MPRYLQFPKPDRAWSTNEDRRLHWRQRHELVQTWNQAAFVYARQAKMRELPPSRVTISIPFRSQRRRDPHNYTGTVVKAIVDGLVRASLWPDDTPNWVRVAEPVLTSGDTVLVTIEPLREEG